MCQHCCRRGDTALNKIYEITALMESRFQASWEWERTGN